MLSRLALIVLVAACGRGMEMRETVERMVMVRTTGSDLQPAATGYIYKKQNDGPESVVEMNESEVMEQLAKLYDQPKSFAAPIPVAKGRIQLNEADENNAESQGKERVIPVKENNEDHAHGAAQDDHVDGISDVDYKKIFDEYTAHYGDNTAYDDYIRKLGLFDDNYKGAKRDHGGYKTFKNNHHFDNGDAGDDQYEKYESYAYSGKNEQKNEYDGANDKKNYDSDDANHHDGQAYNKEGNAYGFRKVFDKEGHVYDGDGSKIGFRNFGSKYYGADSGEHDDSKEQHSSSEADQGSDYDGSGHQRGGEQGAARGERHSSDEQHGAHADSGEAGQSYGFEIKH